MFCAIKTYYFLEWKLFIRSKYYHLVDWRGGVNRLDVTKAPKGKVELWCCNEVQGLVKTLVKWCIEYTWRYRGWSHLETLEE